MPDKPLVWVGASREDLRAFPEDVQDVMGFALRQAQGGRKHIAAKPLTGFGSAAVLEIVDDYDGDTYRGVYTVKFTEAIYVLHIFQKKSKTGKATPKRELETVRRRLAQAQEVHDAWLREQSGGKAT